MKAVTLFSGPGGSTLGLKWAGIEDVTGVEWDASAVATARAAGPLRPHDDPQPTRRHHDSTGPGRVVDRAGGGGRRTASRWGSGTTDLCVPICSSGRQATRN